MLPWEREKGSDCAWGKGTYSPCEPCAWVYYVLKSMRPLGRFGMTSYMVQLVRTILGSRKVAVMLAVPLCLPPVAETWREVCESAPGSKAADSKQ